MFGIPGGWEWILIVVVILLLFGAKKIPELMKGLGSGIRDFKKSLNADDTDKELPKSSETKSGN